jgi:hypothetical protein
MSIATNVKLLYFGTHASVPSAFPRDTDFDEKFISGCSASDMTGGGTGGQQSHSHEIDITHTHSVSADTSSEKNKATPGLSVCADSHKHLDGETRTENTEWYWAEKENRPAYYDVIVCSSDGTADLPLNMGGFCETTTLDGFIEHTASHRKMIRGAETGSNAGGTSGSDTHYHTANVPHAHPDFDSSSADTGNITGTGRGAISQNHTHRISFSLTTPETQYADSLPPYSSLAVMYNTALGNIPLKTGFIGMWKNSKSTIPANWVEVEGQREMFIRAYSGFGDIIQTGGSTQHNHNSKDHAHNLTAGSATGTELGQNSFIGSTVATNSHTHIWSISNAFVKANNNIAESHYPEYIRVYFIRYTEPIITERDLKASWIIAAPKRFITNIRSNIVSTFENKIERFNLKPCANIDLPIVETVSYLLPKIHLKCNDNAANTIVENVGSLGESGTASANTSLLTASGKINQAFNFNKLYSVNLANYISGIKSDSQGTIILWVKPYATADQGIVFCYGYPHYLSSYLYLLYSTAGNYFIFYINKDSSTNYGWTSPVVPDETSFHMISIVQNGTLLSGKLNNSSVGSSQGGNDAGLWLGDLSQSVTLFDLAKSALSSNNYSSSIDNFLYYSEALSDEQLDFIYNSGNGTEDEIMV